METESAHPGFNTLVKRYETLSSSSQGDNIGFDTKMSGEEARQKPVKCNVSMRGDTVRIKSIGAEALCPQTEPKPVMKHVPKGFQQALDHHCQEHLTAYAKSKPHKLAKKKEANIGKNQSMRLDKQEELSQSNVPDRSSSFAGFQRKHRANNADSDIKGETVRKFGSVTVTDSGNALSWEPEEVERIFRKYVCKCPNCWC